jgi:predicted kinase
LPGRRIPTLIVISGPPRSGTATVAHAIGRALPCPVVCRDEIKEGMVHAHGGDFVPGPGDPLTQPTLTLFFEVLGLLLNAGVTVVAEAAFVDQRWRAGLEPLADLAQLRIVQCHVDPAIARERRDEAVAAGSGKAHAQLIGQELKDWEDAYASFERLSLPAPSIDVDTSNGLDPSLDEIVAFINAA